MALRVDALPSEPVRPVDFRRGQKRVVLDLFCGAGGASTGYARAGFDVVGVDIKPQPNYPFEFCQMDAVVLLQHFTKGPAALLDLACNVDVIHASPPCQAFTQMSAKYRGKGGKADSHPDLLTPTRALLGRVTQPWVIENVVGARRAMQPTLSLHGGMFGLGVHRPRLFESNTLLMTFKAPSTTEPLGVYGTKPDGRTLWRYRNSMKSDGTYGKRTLMRAPRSLQEASAAMGIDWMTWDELREAIPPAYTEFIGRQFLAILERSAGVSA